MLFREEAEIELKVKKEILALVSEKEKQAKRLYEAYMMERANLEQDVEFKEKKLLK